MSGMKNAIKFNNLSFAQHGTVRLRELGSGDAARRGRRASSTSVKNAECAAAQFIVLCEQEHGISRRAFRQLILEALSGQQQAEQASYFTDHASVFNDWLYGQRTMPTWASQIVAELMFGMLEDPTTKSKLRTVVLRFLPKVIAEVAGGEILLAWLIRAHGRRVAHGVVNRG